MEIRRIVEQKTWSGPPPTLISPNSVVFSTGEEIEIGFDAVRIRHEGRQIELEMEANRDALRELQKVLWGLSPKWSDGEPLTDEQVSELAGKLSAAAEVMNHGIRQRYY